MYGTPSNRNPILSPLTGRYSTGRNTRVGRRLTAGAMPASAGPEYSGVGRFMTSQPHLMLTPYRPNQMPRRHHFWIRLSRRMDRTAFAIASAAAFSVGSLSLSVSRCQRKLRAPRMRSCRSDWRNASRYIARAFSRRCFSDSSCWSWKYVWPPPATIDPNVKTCGTAKSSGWSRLISFPSWS
jgi:hypothetical protein